MPRQVEGIEIDKYNEALHDFELALPNLEQNPNWDPKWRKKSQAFIQNGCAAAFAGLGDFDRALTEFDASLSACPTTLGPITIEPTPTIFEANERKRSLMTASLSLKGSLG
jgi:tetratricopeptide (TPR) repeat protein